MTDWNFAVGQVEGRATVLVRVNGAPEPAYFILLDWNGDRLIGIRDFRYARNVMDGADWKQ